MTPCSGAERRECVPVGWCEPVTVRDDSYPGSRGDQAAMCAGDAAIPASVTGAPLVLAWVHGQCSWPPPELLVTVSITSGTAAPPVGVPGPDDVPFVLAGRPR